MILGLSPEPGGELIEAEGGLLAVMAEEFVTRLESVTRAGLVPRLRHDAIRLAVSTRKASHRRSDTRRRSRRIPRSIPRRRTGIRPTDALAPHRESNGLCITSPRTAARRSASASKPRPRRWPLSRKNQVSESDYAATAARATCRGLFACSWKSADSSRNGLTCADPLGNGESRVPH